MPSPTACCLPYAQASAAQRTQALHYLLARLRLHFPTLPERVFARTLAEFRPELVLHEPLVSLAPSILQQVVQYLGNSPELPPLDPPLYCRPALTLAQCVLHGRELVAAALPELLPGPVGPRLHALLAYLSQAQPLAEQIVQAQRWDLPGSSPLPPGVPGGSPVPGSAAAAGYLAQLGHLASA